MSDWVKNVELSGADVTNNVISLTGMTELGRYAFKKHVNDDPLCFTANTAGSTVTLTSAGPILPLPTWSGYTSSDGKSWSAYTVGTKITLANEGDKVYFKGTIGTYPDFGACLHFGLTGSIAASGNIMSFCSGDNFATATTLPGDYCFFKLFKADADVNYGISAQEEVLTSIPSLPATGLTQHCYDNMFYSCTSITNLPALPATVIPNSAYYAMFCKCSSLEVSDEATSTATVEYKLPSTGVCTSLGNQGTYSMFFGCSVVPASGTTPALLNTQKTYYTQNKAVK